MKTQGNESLNITEDFIPKGQGIRTGIKLQNLRGLVIHWIGVAQPSAQVIRNNFARSQYGTHYIIDYATGDIIHCVPDNEVCYHVGANTYTPTKQAVCGMTNPNYCFVGIECCISANDKIYDDYFNKEKYPNLGKPSDVQYKRLVEFCAYWLAKNNLRANQLYRHYDITGKACHVWFKNEESRWEEFKLEVAKKMKPIEEYTEVEHIVWDLHHRGIITNKELWMEKLTEDKNSYWLARKALHYIRERD